LPPTPRTIPVAFLTFIALGVTCGLLGLAWPSIRAEFHLELDSINDIYLGSTVAYLLPSLFIGRLASRFGSATILLTGAAILAASMFGLSISPNWYAVVAFSALSGFGSGLIDAGLNLYLATYHGPRQMSWLHASFGIGITLGPLIMVAALHRPLGWRAGYAVAGIVMLIPVVLLGLTFRQWRNDPHQTDTSQPTARATFAQSFRIPAVWLGAGMFIACVGVEIAAGQWAFTFLTQSRTFPTDRAGVVVSAYWAAFTGGRILFGFVANRFDPVRLLPILLAAMLAGTVLFWWNPLPAFGISGLFILGFAEAPAFPLLMTGTRRRVGPAHAENAVGLQMLSSGIASAILPGLVGTAARYLGLHAIPMSLFALAALALILNLLSLPKNPIEIAINDKLHTPPQKHVRFCAIVCNSRSMLCRNPQSQIRPLRLRYPLWTKRSPIHPSPPAVTACSSKRESNWKTWPDRPAPPMRR